MKKIITYKEVATPLTSFRIRVFYNFRNKFCALKYFEIFDNFEIEIDIYIS